MDFEFPGCAGWVTLLSNKNADEITIESKKLQKAMRKRRKGKKNVKRKIKQVGFRFAKINGNCCWKVGERFSGGENQELWTPHTYYLPWSIRSVRLIDCN